MLFELRVPGTGLEFWVREYSRYYVDAEAIRIGRVTQSNCTLTPDKVLRLGVMGTARRAGQIRVCP